MAERYTKIDMKTWKRAQHCAVFRGSAQPMYSVSFELDITRFLAVIRTKKLSFTLSFLYAAAVSANGIEEFRYRFVDGDVVLYDRIDTSFTYLNPDTELFKVVNVPMQDTLEDYVALASRTAAAQQVYFTGPLANNVFSFSPLPWVAFTHVSHTDSGKTDNAIPMIDWGRYYEKDGRIMLPFSVQVHHSFVDGVHIGKLADALQQFLDEYE